MNLKDLSTINGLKAVIASTRLSVGELFSYDHLRRYWALYIYKSGYYGSYDPITKETIALENYETDFISTIVVNLLIEGFVSLPKTPTVVGGGSIAYTGYGILEVAGTKIYDGRSSGGGGGGSFGSLTGIPSDNSALNNALNNKQGSLGYTPENVANKGVVNGYPSLDGAGKIPLAQLPVSSLETLYVYGGAATLPENAGLTYTNVQNGDTVKMNSTGLMYIVNNDTALSTAGSFTIYTAGTASSVPYSGITSKPTTVSGYGITDGEVNTNKDTDGTLTANSDTKYGSQKAVKTYIDTNLSGKQATLGFTPENSINKDVDGTLSSNSDIKYPSQKAIKTYTDTGLATKQNSLGFTPENSANKGLVNGYPSLDAAGKIPITQIPAAAIETVYVYAGAATLPENAGLTTSNVQNGDIVKMNSTGIMYVVKNDAALSTAGSFEPFNAGTAASVPFSGVTGKPTSLAGYGIVDPIVLTSGTYADPTWLTSLVFSKLTGKPTTLSGYGITDPVVLTSTTYSDPSWISALNFSKITSKPATLSGYGITDAEPARSWTNVTWVTATTVDLSGTGNYKNIQNVTGDQTITYNSGSGLTSNQNVSFIIDKETASVVNVTLPLNSILDIQVDKSEISYSGTVVTFSTASVIGSKYTFQVREVSGFLRTTISKIASDILVSSTKILYTNNVSKAWSAIAGATVSTDQIAYSLVIPANTFTAGTVIELSYIASPATGVNSKTFKIYDQSAGATTGLMSSAFVSGAGTGMLCNEVMISNQTISTQVLFKKNSTGATRTTLALDWSVQRTIIFAININNVTESASAFDSILIKYNN